jgi:hypothetical protein
MGFSVAPDYAEIGRPERVLFSSDRDAAGCDLFCGDFKGIGNSCSRNRRLVIRDRIEPTVAELRTENPATLVPLNDLFK